MERSPRSEGQSSAQDERRRADPLAGARLLLADDEAAVRASLALVLRQLGTKVVTAPDGASAIGRLQAEPFDLVISDLAMPGQDGFAVLEAAARLQPRTPVVFLTGQGSMRECVRAMREGAFDFLVKPCHPSVLEETARAALIASLPAERPAVICGRPTQRAASIVGRSRALAEALATVEQAALSSACVLISGEAGTGKEVLARLLHAASPRSQARLVAVNCAALEEELLEHTLFGQSGASPDGEPALPGSIRDAEGGTLFLDEIGELPLPLQIRLLRVLSERQVSAAAGDRPRPVDVRVVAATTQDLESLVGRGRFRQDLLQRLNAVPVRVPPLRERPEDVGALVTHFLESCRRRLGKSVTVSAPALAALQLHPWPGNVRELQNLIEHLVMLDQHGVIELESLPSYLQAPAASATVAAAQSMAQGGLDLGVAVAGFERSLIGIALERSGGNKTRAAALLGVRRTTLIDKMRRLGFALS